MVLVPCCVCGHFLKNRKVGQNVSRSAQVTSRRFKPVRRL
ncbi:hypothetical protein CAMRE0001_3267 [Campylobacter rectus RM3267]|uniref:Uncharacterized protein n=1 Tax=Campylobacter rectus RM3267 TaxID=553218 RepID=B9D5L8_CAMRE|nr:hypothetical protein CAMRE0001_3267 [Campylobacter rectus RM3267]